MKPFARRIVCGRAVEKGIHKAICVTLLPLILFACVRQGLKPPSTAPAPLTEKKPGGEVPPLLGRQDIGTLDADLQGFIPPLMKQARIPGLQIALIRDGQIAWHHNFGVRNAKTSETVTDETIFEAASLTKPFFAYYVMKLVDQGVVSLDKPLIGYLPVDIVEKLTSLSRRF